LSVLGTPTYNVNIPPIDKPEIARLSAEASTRKSFSTEGITLSNISLPTLSKPPTLASKLTINIGLALPSAIRLSRIISPLPC
jgi:glycine cleavage system regulatory protein